MNEKPEVLTKEMKDWFGKGEFDIDRMIELGITTEAYILQCCKVLTDSPWHKKGQE